MGTTDIMGAPQTSILLIPLTLPRHPAGLLLHLTRHHHHHLPLKGVRGQEGATEPNLKPQVAFFIQHSLHTLHYACIHSLYATSQPCKYMSSHVTSSLNPSKNHHTKQLNFLYFLYHYVIIPHELVKLLTV